MKRTRNLPQLAVATTAVLMLALPTNVWAVGVTTTTYASDTGDPAYTPGIGTGHTPQKNAQTLMDPLGPLTSNITSNVTTAHAQAWGTAKVVAPTGVVKSASGRSWIDAVVSPNPTYDARAFTWSALATGTELELHWDPKNGPQPQFAQMQLFLPSSFDDGYNDSVQGYAPASLPHPNQGFYTDAAIAPSGAASSFNLNFNISAAYSTDGTTFTTQYQGGGVIDSDTTKVHLSGDLSKNFSDPSQIFPTTNFGDHPGFKVVDGGVTLGTLAVDIPFDTPFYMDFSVYMSMGDPNDIGAVNQDFSYGNLSAPLGGAGSLGVILQPTDSRILVSAVPEPSSIALLVLGSLSLVAVGRRRLRAA